MKPTLKNVKVLIANCIDQAMFIIDTPTPTS